MENQKGISERGPRRSTSRKIVSKQSSVWREKTIYPELQEYSTQSRDIIAGQELELPRRQ